MGMSLTMASISYEGDVLKASRILFSASFLELSDNTS